MNNQFQKGSHPFNQRKVENKAIAIQKDFDRTEVETFDFSQKDIHSLVLTIFKILLPFLILMMTYITNQ